MDSKSPPFPHLCVVFNILCLSPTNPTQYTDVHSHTCTNTLHFLLNMIYCVCRNILPTCVLCMHMPYIRAVPTEIRRGCWIPGNEATNSCESSCGCWESNLNPLKRQLVLFTLAPSLQPPSFRRWVLNGVCGFKFGDSVLKWRNTFISTIMNTED